MAALSDTKLRSLKPRTKGYEIADAGGLYAYILPSGSISFRYQYRLAGRKERVVLGKYPAVSLARARQLHRNFQTMVDQGISPARHMQKEKARRQGLANDVFKVVAESWLSHWAASKSADVVYHVRRWLERDVYPKIGQHSVSSIKPTDVLDLIDDIKQRGAPQSARRVHGILKQVFDYAINRLLIETNPAERIKASSIATVSNRSRVLSPKEINAFVRALDTSTCREPTKVAVRLILLTMVRKRELLRARWEDVDLQSGIWTIPRTKNGKALEVYLSRQVVELFERLRAMAHGSPFVLPHLSRLEQPMGDSTLNEAIDRIIDQNTERLTHFTVHDLRRTASTHLHEAGFASDVIEKALNHVMGGVRGIYNKAEYADQRRAMLQQWADMLDAWAESGTVVVSLRGKAA